MPISESYRENIRMALARRAGEASDATTVAAATLSIWQLMAARLEPVIGASGVAVLFIRALHLTSAAFPWLAIAETQRESAPLYVKTQLAEQEITAATEAAYTLLVTFTELLSTLIGESLSERLLGPVWVPSAGESLAAGHGGSQGARQRPQHRDKALQILPITASSSATRCSTTRESPAGNRRRVKV